MELAEDALSLVKSIGLPGLVEGEDPPLNEALSLLQLVELNEMPLLYLGSPRKFRRRMTLEAQLSRYRGKHWKTLDLTSLVSSLLEEAGLPYTIFQTLKPFPYTPADIDILLQSKGDFTKASQTLEKRDLETVQRNKEYMFFILRGYVLDPFFICIFIHVPANLSIVSEILNKKLGLRGMKIDKKLALTLLSLLALPLMCLSVNATATEPVPLAGGDFGTVIETYQEPGFGRDWVWTGYNPSITSYYWRWASPNPEHSAGDSLDLHWVNPIGLNSYVIWDMGSKVAGVRVYPTQDELGWDMTTGAKNTDPNNVNEFEYHEYSVYASNNLTNWIGPLTETAFWLEGYDTRPEAVADDAVKDYYFGGTCYQYVKIMPRHDYNPFTRASKWYEGDYEIDAVQALYFEFHKVAILESTEDGDDIIEVGEEVVWSFKITVRNLYDWTMEDVVVCDRFAAEIEIYGEVDVPEGTRLKIWTKGKSEKIFLKWEIGELAPGETAALILPISTDKNPAGKQGYTSPGHYELNSGAVLKFIDINGFQHSAHTGSIEFDVPGKMPEF